MPFFRTDFRAVLGAGAILLALGVYLARRGQKRVSGAVSAARGASGS